MVKKGETVPFFSDLFKEMHTVEVARGLLGHYLCHQTPAGLVSGIIVETEAYLSRGDPACHAASGKTRRNETMFGPAGMAYVYFIYGNYYCFNVVTRPIGTGEAVLIRAVEPTSGLNIMKQNRGPKYEQLNLANGPGKLCIAFGIDKKYDGHDLNCKPLYLDENSQRGELEITAATRIGISVGIEKMYRFYISGSQYVSRR